MLEKYRFIGSLVAVAVLLGACQNPRTEPVSAANWSNGISTQEQAMNDQEACRRMAIGHAQSSGPEFGGASSSPNDEVRRQREAANEALSANEAQMAYENCLSERRYAPTPHG
jgi:hypothetical protein